MILEQILQLLDEPFIGLCLTGDEKATLNHYIKQLERIVDEYSRIIREKL